MIRYIVCGCRLHLELKTLRLETLELITLELTNFIIENCPHLIYAVAVCFFLIKRNNIITFHVTNI